MRGEPDSTVVDEAVRRVVKVARPLRIILYGSGARGEMAEGSDLDLMVVYHSPVDRPVMAQAIQRSMVGLGIPVDVLVVSEEFLASKKDDPGYIFRTVLAEGKVVYASPPGDGN